jgi:hypothetical protein
MRLPVSARTFEEGFRWSHKPTATSGRRVQGGTPMNQNTPFRFARTIVLGLVVATAVVAPAAGAAIDPRFVDPTAGAMVALTGQPALPPGATLEPTVTGQPALPPGATLEPTVAGQPALPPGAAPEPIVAPTEQPGGAVVVPSPSGPVVEALDGFDWADAGLGAGIALGGVLLLGGALLVFRRAGQRQRLALH